jgi:hypothetical protein
MAVKPAPKAVFPAGPTDFGKRKTKALQKRPYQAPQITKLIRPPAVGPVDARPESESSGSSGSDDSDDDANSSDSESKSMEIDEDSTATAISTEKPTEIKSAKTTRSVYKSAEIAFPDGRKSVVKFGSAVNVRFFDGDENCEDVTTCYALVREIWSVRRNDERMKSLGKEATEEEVGSGIMFNVSWLLDLNELTKNWQHEPSYPIPDNERFYDPRDIDTVLPANVTCVEPEHEQPLGDTAREFETAVREQNRGHQIAGGQNLEIRGVQHDRQGLLRSTQGAHRTGSDASRAEGRGRRGFV